MIIKQPLKATKFWERLPAHTWKGIIWHVDLGTRQGTWATIHGTKSVSYHYYITKDGTIYEYVDPDIRQAWHAGNVHEPTEAASALIGKRNPNRLAIGVCYEGRQVGNDGELATDDQVVSAAWLKEHLEGKYGPLWDVAHVEITSYKPKSVLDLKRRIIALQQKKRTEYSALEFYMQEGLELILSVDGEPVNIPNGKKIQVKVIRDDSRGGLGNYGASLLGDSVVNAK